MKMMNMKMHKVQLLLKISNKMKIIILIKSNRKNKLKIHHHKQVLLKRKINQIKSHNLNSNKNNHKKNWKSQFQKVLKIY